MRNAISIDLVELKCRAVDALAAISAFEDLYGKSAVLDSIRAQMNFVFTEAEHGRNPLESINTRSPLTFGILSSREFSSPDELKLKAKLNRVAELLY
ncbi:immunity protein Tsi6 family protein [Microbulbifer sp. MCCC 1A16149]|uniref:immunity protein Tsi6 family protein n=1 Tax=Microbulbifer sp. MCCC 1A16149 TaxID=3411322 RepID=UPI003D0B22C1